MRDAARQADLRQDNSHCCSAASGILVETLLKRDTDANISEAEAAIERLAERGSMTVPVRGYLVAADARINGSGPRRRHRLPRLSGPLPRHGEIPWLRGAHRLVRGDAMMAAAPSGVVTFLFTDVEGSTRRWEADANGDAGGAGRP